MRRKPLAVGRIPREAAAKMIVYAALVHLPQSVFKLFLRGLVSGVIGVALQEYQVMRRRELRRAAEAAVFGVIARGELPRGLSQQLIIQRCGFSLRQCAQRRRNVAPRAQQLIPAAAPFSGHGAQQLQKPDPPAGAVLRQIRPRKERLLLRRHYDRQRPARAAGERLTHADIHRVHIRPLLPVHLYGDEVPVQHLRYLPILERLVRHHMAPVAGRIPDAQKHRLVLPPRLLKGRRAPREPVHGVLRVLKQIGGLFVYQRVAHAAPPKFRL